MSRLIVVVDNTVGVTSLLGEHGVSMWLEHQGLNLLYDTGAGFALLPNLEALGLDPNDLDGLVLSHGHHDHTGGLAGLLNARSEPLDIWCHPSVFGSHLVRHEGMPAREIGPPLGGQEQYEAAGARFHFIEENANPWEGITLLASIERATDFEGPAPGLMALIDGELAPDPFPDDLAMLVHGDAGPAVLTGCAHAGVINVLLAAEAVAAGPLQAVIGGTHLGPAPVAQQSRALEELLDRPELHVVSGHCTGAAMNALLARTLGERFIPLQAGLVLEL